MYKKYLENTDNINQIIYNTIFNISHENIIKAFASQGVDASTMDDHDYVKRYERDISDFFYAYEPPSRKNKNSKFVETVQERVKTTLEAFGEDEVDFKKLCEIVEVILKDEDFAWDLTK